jgi:hypothetical protein
MDGHIELEEAITQALTEFATLYPDYVVDRVDVMDAGPDVSPHEADSPRFCVAVTVTPAKRKAPSVT